MEDMLTTLARQYLPQMSEEEKFAALTSLKRLIDEEFFGMAKGSDKATANVKCPRCDSARVVKKGHSAAGEQRWLCRSCLRTFSGRTNKVFATTKLDRATWMEYARCHIDVLPLREVAQRCNVSLKTAFFMRHRVLECISLCLPIFRSNTGDGMEIDECYLRESFKGNRNNAKCGIPRKPRCSGKSVTDNREQICVLTGINDAGDFFFELAGRGNIDEGRAAACLEGKVTSGAIVATDNANAYIKALRKLNVFKHIACSSKAHAINRVNSLHSRIVEFIKGFHGVATRRLWNYLAWFKWIWSFRRGRDAVKSSGLVVRQVGESAYKTTWRNYKNTPYPFYDYWVKQAKWDARARAALPLAMGGVSIVG